MTNELSLNELRRIAGEFRDSGFKDLRHLRITGYAVRENSYLVDLMVGAIAGRDAVQLKGYKGYRLAFWGKGASEYIEISRRAVALLDKLGLVGWEKPGTPLFWPTFMDGENEPGHVMAHYVDQIALLSGEAVLQPDRGKPEIFTGMKSPFADMRSITFPHGCIDRRDVENFFKDRQTESTSAEWFEGLIKDVTDGDFDPIVVFDNDLFSATACAIEWLVSQQGGVTKPQPKTPKTGRRRRTPEQWQLIIEAAKDANPAMSKADFAKQNSRDEKGFLGILREHPHLKRLWHSYDRNRDVAGSSPKRSSRILSSKKGGASR